MTEIRLPSAMPIKLAQVTTEANIVKKQLLEKITSPYIRFPCKIYVLQPSPEVEADLQSWAKQDGWSLKFSAVQASEDGYDGRYTTTKHVVELDFL